MRPFKLLLDLLYPPKCPFCGRVLERGVISAAAAWSDFAVGYLAVEGALALARGERAEVEQPPFFIVRGEDIYEPEYQKLLFPVTG